MHVSALFLYLVLLFLLVGGIHRGFRCDLEIQIERVAEAERRIAGVHECLDWRGGDASKGGCGVEEGDEGVQAKDLAASRRDEQLAH